MRIGLRMGCSRKILPSPHRGGWICRFFGVKYSHGFPAFFEQKSLFSYRFPQKNHKGTQNPHFLFSHSGFPGKFCKKASGIPDFAYVAMTSSVGEGRIYLE